MFDAIYNIVLFIISLSILVAIHEGGHFLAARLCGVKVLRFSIGFGKVLFKKTSAKDGCEYAISAIPLGGYVKMLGEENDNVEACDLDKSFASKSKLQRAFIIIAGPLANIILAFVLYTCVFTQGENIVRPYIAHVSSQSLAMQAGFKNDDVIVAVDDKPVKSLNEFILALVDNAGNEVNVSVNNEQEQVVRNLKLDLTKLEIKPNLNILSYIGLSPKTAILSNTISYVKEDSSAFRAGIKVGDIIVGIDDLYSNNFYDIQDYIKLHGDKVLAIHLLREGKPLTISLLPNAIYDAALNKDIYQIGIAPSVTPYDDLIQKIDYTFTQAIARATTQTYEMGLLIIRSVGKMISGAISYENLSGPITIAKGASQSVELGFTYYLGFLALISVNLGILNLCPIPVLDGGQLVFIAYEAIARKKANEKMQVFLSMLGMLLLFILTFFAIFNDFRTL